MSALARHLEDYLAMRRALGFRLERAGALLAQFVDLRRGERCRTSSRSSSRWRGHASQGMRSPIWVARRLEVVRRFARHMAVVDPTNEVIPTDLWSRPGHAPHALPVLARGDHCLDGRGETAGEPVEGGDLRDPRRPACLHRTASWGGDAPRPRRLRRRARRC